MQRKVREMRTRKQALVTPFSSQHIAAGRSLKFSIQWANIVVFYLFSPFGIKSPRNSRDWQVKTHKAFRTVFKMPFKLGWFVTTVFHCYSRCNKILHFILMKFYHNKMHMCLTDLPIASKFTERNWEEKSSRY